MKWKWRNDRRSEHNLCNCVKKPEKKSGLQLQSVDLFVANILGIKNSLPQGYFQFLIKTTASSFGISTLEIPQEWTSRLYLPVKWTSEFKGFCSMQLGDPA